MANDEINSNSASLYVPGIEEIKDSYAFDHCFALGCERCSEVEEGYDLHIAEFNAWLAEHDRQVSEKRWAEGFKLGVYYDVRDRENVEAGLTLNPYQEKENND